MTDFNVYVKIQLNVLIDDQGNPVLSDFGLAEIMREVESEPSISSFSRDPRWNSMELLLDSEAVVSEKSDIWSLGMVMLQVRFTGNVCVFDVNLSFL